MTARGDQGIPSRSQQLSSNKYIYIFVVVPEDQSDWHVPSLAISGGPQRIHMCGPDITAGTANIGNTWVIIELTKRLHNRK